LAGCGEVLSEVGIDQRGHVHCVGDSPGDVVAQQRLVVRDTVPQAMQAPDRPIDITAVGAGGEGVVQCRDPQRLLMRSGAQEAPEPEHQLRNYFAGRCSRPTGGFHRSL